MLEEGGRDEPRTEKEVRDVEVPRSDLGGGQADLETCPIGEISEGTNRESQDAGGKTATEEKMALEVLKGVESVGTFQQVDPMDPRRMQEEGVLRTPAVEEEIAKLAKNINWDLEDYLSEPEEGGLRDQNLEERQVGLGTEGGAGGGPRGAESSRGGGGSHKWVSKGNTVDARKAPDYGMERKVGRPPRKATRDKETQAQIDLGYQSTLREGGALEGPNLRSRKG